MSTTYEEVSTLRQKNKTLRLEAEEHKITIRKQSEDYYKATEQILRLQQLLLDQGETLNILRHALSIEG